jgi:hypothetical protein
MKKKTKKILIGLLVLLFLIWLIKLGITDGLKYQKDTTYEHKLGKNINTIILKNKDTQLIFTKNAQNKWYNQQNKLPVASQKIDSLFKTIKAFSKKKLVSSNPTKQTIYAVSSANTTISLQANKQTKLSFIIGKQGPTRNSNYLRFSQKNKVYLIEQPLEFIFNLDEKKWKDLSLLKINNPNVVKNLSLQVGKQKLDLIRQENNWVLAPEKTTTKNASELNPLFEMFWFLNASDIMLASSVLPQETKLKKPSIKITFGLKDAKKVDLIIGPEIKSEHYVAISTRKNFVYKITKPTYDYIYKTCKTLF